MIQSMTAFARVQSQTGKGNFVCELRSINHRYLEFSLRLPDVLHACEVLMRDLIREHVKRGKVECYFSYQAASSADASITVNKALAKKVCEATEMVAAMLEKPGAINPMSVLHWPGILETPTVTIEAVQDDVLKLLETALKELIEARQREGEQLKKLFLQRLDTIKIEIDKVKKRLPTILESQRQRLVGRFTEAKLQLDSNRLEQELVLFAQKIDVSEELERLGTHVIEVRRVLEQGGAMGRRLDFLMQELNREANTLGSKSVDAETTRAAVELKVLIEQIREQVQNIE
jgi:uncharacterized protein (TIGR00255 family)